MEFLTSIESYEHIRVCRVCLIMDVKMYDLRTFPLETYFEAVIGIPVISTLDLPPFLCYECASIVRKFSLFRERCLQGQSTLYGITKDSPTGKFTKQDILAVDRVGNGLISNLKICACTEQINLSCLEQVQTIKEEPDVVLQDVKSGVELEDTVDVKEEIEFDFPELDFQQSSDDEPLSVHKTLKEENEKKRGKKRGRKKKEKEEVVSANENSQVKQEETSQVGSDDPSNNPYSCSNKSKPPRRVPAEPRPRKTKNTGGVVFEDVSLDEYVNVVYLTLEEQLQEIEERKKSTNYLEAPFKCEMCYKGFVDANAWKHHLGKHDPSAGDVECPVCKIRFETNRTLQKHVHIHEKKFKCKSCDYVSRTTTQAKHHQRWHIGITYKCQYCDEVSTQWTSYLSHVRIKHPSEHICPVCGYSFVSQLGLAMHRTMRHKQKTPEGEAEGPYCEACDVKFVSTEAYNRHMVTSSKHSQGDNFSKGCKVCGARFSSPEEVRAHHRAEHSVPKTKSYRKKRYNPDSWPQDCAHCGESIVCPRELWTHYRRAHPDLPYPIQKDYVCDICGKAFRGQAFLKYHKRTHTTERAYKCSLCDKAFFNGHNLSMHVRTHSAARPYPCDVCCKAFKSKGALDRHYRTHTGVKPYECEVCGKAFNQSNSRKLHVKTVHLKQPVTRRARNDKNKLHETPAEPQPFVY